VTTAHEGAAAAGSGIYFVQVPTYLLDAVYDPGSPVNAVAFALHAHIVRRYVWRRAIFPSHATLAQETGQSISSVQRSLRALKAAGAIDWRTCVNSRGKTSNEYAVAPVDPFQFDWGRREPRVVPVTSDRNPSVTSDRNPSVKSDRGSERELEVREEVSETTSEADVVIEAEVVTDDPLVADATANRADVESLCQELADLIVANGSRRPTVTKKWRDAARLMIDRDGIPVDMIMGAIRWSQGNDFWKAHILSMPKLRDKYDTMRLQAESSPTRRVATTDRKLQDARALADRLRAQGR
jgi:hypothetical protein